MDNYYFIAAFTRKDDCEHLRKNDNSIMFSIYCAGVAVECMIRAYAERFKTPFDEKHDLKKLFNESQMTHLLSIKERDKLVEYLSKMGIWNNNLRYYSNEKMRSIIAMKFFKSKAKNFNKFLKYISKEYFNAAYEIIKLGESKW